MRHSCGTRSKSGEAEGRCRGFRKIYFSGSTRLRIGIRVVIQAEFTVIDGGEVQEDPEIQLLDEKVGGVRIDRPDFAGNVEGPLAAMDGAMEKLESKRGGLKDNLAVT